MKNAIILIMGFSGLEKDLYLQTLRNKKFKIFALDQYNYEKKDILKEWNSLVKTTETIRFAVHNSFPTIKTRKPFVNWAQSQKIAIHCRWLKGNISDAQFYIAYRMKKRYNELLNEQAIRENDDRDIFPQQVLYRYRKLLEPPTSFQGFDSIKKVPLKRDRNPNKYKNKAVVFDYDETLRSTKSGSKYPLSPEDIEILPHRRSRIREYKKKGYKLLGVSNQSGIGKGDLSEEEAIACFEKTNQLLGFEIDYRFCPHHNFPPTCYCRKPIPGLGVDLIIDYELDPSKTIMVGDMKSDQTFAERCGFQFISSEKFFNS
jgi:HAD superfamily hydrolase (TIGR01662 family)